MEKVLNVKFLNFGCLTKIEDAENMRIPDQVDHLPPNMNSHLLLNFRFSNQLCTPNRKNSSNETIKFLQAVTSADVYSLGVILLQIFTGCPSQLDVTAKFKCYTVDDKMFLGVPHFGYCIEGKVDNMYVSQTIKWQERFIKYSSQLVQLRQEMKIYGFNQKSELYRLI